MEPAAGAVTWVPAYPGDDGTGLGERASHRGQTQTGPPPTVWGPIRFQILCPVPVSAMHRPLGPREPHYRLMTTGRYTRSTGCPATLTPTSYVNAHPPMFGLSCATLRKYVPVSGHIHWSREAGGA